MTKRHLTRLAEIYEKLSIASDKEAFSLLTKCEALIAKAKIDFVKKDFSLRLADAIFQISDILPRHGSRCNDINRGIYESLWYSTEHPDEHISLCLDCHNLKNILFSIVVWKRTDEKLMIKWDNLVKPPKGLVKIMAGLDGFSEEKTGMWSKSLGTVNSIAQARRIILPVWENVYNAIKPFGDKW